MKYQLVDKILEQSDERIVVLKQVTLAEEYLGDHFPGFPVLPGVMMVETMVQAARELLRSRGERRLVLGEMRALKFGNMVRPGEQLVMEVTIAAAPNEGQYTCKGVGRVGGVGRNGRDAAELETAVSGKFTMRRICSG